MGLFNSFFKKKSDFEILLDRANKGEKDSIFDLGYYYSGIGEIEKALYYYKMIEDDFIEIPYNIALLLLGGNSPQPKEGVRYLIKAFKMGNPGAAAELSKLHALGYAVEKNYNVALEYFSFALQKNYDKCIESVLSSFAIGFDDYGLSLDKCVLIPSLSNGVELEYMYIKEYAFSRGYGYERVSQLLLEFNGRKIDKIVVNLIGSNHNVISQKEFFFDITESFGNFILDGKKVAI